MHGNVSTLFFDFRAALDLGSARVSHADAGPTRTDGVLAMVDFSHLQALSISRSNPSERLSRRDAPSTALRTGCTSTRNTCTTQNRFNPKSKELASCLASSRLLLTLLTLSPFNYLTASAEDTESDVAWASGDAAVSPLPLRSA
jgi:hypothetical protein